MPSQLLQRAAGTRVGALFAVLATVIAAAQILQHPHGGQRLEAALVLLQSLLSLQ